MTDHSKEKRISETKYQKRTRKGIALREGSVWLKREREKVQV